MDRLEQSIISTLLYYQLLERPLSGVELFKFLAADALGKPPNFGDFFVQINKNRLPGSLIEEYNGYYFLKGSDQKKMFAWRQERAKISQLKWKRVKKTAKILQIIPFIEMIGITGSLSLDNAKEGSDLDLLIALKPGRLWTGRLAVTFVLNILGLRRHGSKTKDKICLNCYLASPSLEIKPQAKHRDLHSAQEYARLIPIWPPAATKPQSFHSANIWIKNFIANHPWPDDVNLKTVSPNVWLGAARGAAEFFFSGALGDKIEKWLGQWQTRRIKSKITKGTLADQIYFSNECLMFHPRSKSMTLLTEHNSRLNELLTSNT